MNPDHLLPFRSHAPTLQQARKTILSDAARMGTPAGLFNLAAFRGVFYGSEFAKTDLRWFDSIDEWDGYHTASGKEEAFFVTRAAYGTPQGNRSLTNLSLYWPVASLDWLEHLKANPDKDAIDFFKFFKEKLRNVGELSALLMVGDLVESGFIPPPSGAEMGKMVSVVNKGSVRGLQSLELLGPTPTQNEVVEAFDGLHSFLESALSEEAKGLMRYSTIVLEHGLCKLGRLQKVEKRDLDNDT